MKIDEMYETMLLEQFQKLHPELNDLLVQEYKEAYLYKVKDSKLFIDFKCSHNFEEYLNNLTVNDLPESYHLCQDNVFTTYEYLDIPESHAYLFVLTENADISEVWGADTLSVDARVELIYKNLNK